MTAHTIRDDHERDVRTLETEAMARVARAHDTPCRLPMHECPTCDDRDWHESHARDAARDHE